MMRKDHRRTKSTIRNRKPHQLRPAPAGLHPRAAHTAHRCEPNKVANKMSVLMGERSAPRHKGSKPAGQEH